MHSLFIGFKTHAAFSIQKGRLSLIVFKRNFSFPQLFFFKETKKPPPTPKCIAAGSLPPQRAVTCNKPPSFS